MHFGARSSSTRLTFRRLNRSLLWAGAAGAHLNRLDVRRAAVAGPVSIASLAGHMNVLWR